MNKTTIERETVKNDLCIGCGICVASCPNKAIHMEKCEENYLRPIVDNEKCTNCGSCIRFCPNTFEKIIEESKKVSEYGDFNKFGIDNAKYYISYVKNNGERKKSSSGGIATYIAKYLLKQNKIEAVVHAEMIEGKTGEQHYKASISTTIDELDQKRRSFYCAISFDEVLKKVKENKYKSILIIGTPCVIRGIKNFIIKTYRNVEKLYTIALACSHNVNGMFTDYLADSLNISRNQEYKIDLRNKDNIVNALNYNNHYFNESGTICKINRFESEFTNQWRNYCFSMNICNACSDFWGYTADVSVKDAWGKWDKDPLGQSIVIVRNKELDKIFQDNNDLYIEEETQKTIIDSQFGTVKFKQFYASKRLKCNNSKQFNKISRTHRFNSKMRKISIKKYKKMKNNEFNCSLKRYVQFVMFKKMLIAEIKTIGRKIIKWKI